MPSGDGEWDHADEDFEELESPPSLDSPVRESRWREGPSEPSLQSKRSAVLVWIVFYWIFNGIAGIVIGILLPIMASFARGMASEMMEINRSKSDDEVLVALELVGLGGVLSFHVGLIMLVASYGLWTFRIWALPLARVLAVVFAVGNILGLIFSVVMRQGIGIALFGCIIQGVIVVYLFGAKRVAEYFQRSAAHLSEAGARDAQGFTQ
jgi:hypothetical protein